VSEENWEKFEIESAKNAEFFRSEIENTGKAAYEYGVLLVRNLLLLNGGALVALPAIASVLSDSAKLGVKDAAFFFVFGLALAMVCGYFTHVNWLLHHHAHLELRERRARLIALAYLGAEYQDAKVVEEEKKLGSPFARSIWWTFFIPHVTGIASLVALVVGAYKIL